MLSFLPLIAGVSALGINCRGSAMCTITQFSALTQMRDFVCDPSNNLLNTQFGQGQHIAIANQDSGNSVTIAESINGVYSYALFFQDIGDATHSGSEACDLLNTLVNHGCAGCGSVPISMENGGPNGDVNNGQLTLNFISS